LDRTVKRFGEVGKAIPNRLPFRVTCENNHVRSAVCGGIIASDYARQSCCVSCIGITTGRAKNASQLRLDRAVLFNVFGVASRFET
jgi:hypothetical protein